MFRRITPRLHEAEELEFRHDATGRASRPIEGSRYTLEAGETIPIADEVQSQFSASETLSASLPSVRRQAVLVWATSRYEFLVFPMCIGPVLRGARQGLPVICALCYSGDQHVSPEKFTPRPTSAKARGVFIQRKRNGCDSSEGLAI